MALGPPYDGAVVRLMLVEGVGAEIEIGNATPTDVYGPITR